MKLGSKIYLDEDHWYKLASLNNEIVGLVLVHGLCSPALILWERIEGMPYGPLFTLNSLQPISVEPHMHCTSCGDKGKIINGTWEAL